MAKTLLSAAQLTALLEELGQDTGGGAAELRKRFRKMIGLVVETS